MNNEACLFHGHLYFCLFGEVHFVGSEMERSTVSVLCLISCLFYIHTKATERKTRLRMNDRVTECSVVLTIFYRCQGTDI